MYRKSAKMDINKKRQNLSEKNSHGTSILYGTEIEVTFFKSNRFRKNLKTKNRLLLT